SEQQKYEREYHTIRRRDRETSGEFMKRFLRLEGFVGKKAGPQEEQAKHFKWALCYWILDEIVNTEFTDVAQVANAARTLRFSVRGQGKITRETMMGTVFDRQLKIAIRGVMIRRVMTVIVMTSGVATVIRSHGRTEVSSTTVLLGLQARKDTWTMPPLLHVTHVGNSIRARHVTGLLELVSLMVRLGIWPGIALRMVEMVVEEIGTTSNLLLRGNLVIIDHEYQNYPLRFDDKIRSDNLFPLDMNDFDIILGMDWLTEHRATIVCHTNRVIFGDLDNPEFIYLFQFRG
ncbi:putative reverse transcriptase domain-containing protein, partial [Tanacetum coccineum]